MENEIQISNNEINQRFETNVANQIAFLEYRWYKGDLALMHTLVPEQLAGKGLGSALAKFALEYAKERKLQIMVYCPFVGKYLKTHPEYDFLVDKKYNR